MDDNNTSEEELPLGGGGGGDIEQGGRSTIIIPENTDSVWSSEAAAITGDTTTTSTATTWTPGGLEEVDVEDTGPVPLIQQIADMEMEKNDIIMAREDASTTPTVPPAQDMMLEEIEDGDDVPRPFNSADFEDDESKPEIDLGMESADEDDGPPLPFSYERESVSDDAKKKAATPQIVSSSSNGQTEAADASAADGNQSIGDDPVAQQMNDNPFPAPGDEENNLQQLVEPASDEVVPSVSERYPSLPIFQAYLVEPEEEERVDAPPLNAAVATLTPGARDIVCEATPVEPELPWWKQRRTKVFMTIICILMIAMAVGIGAAFSRPIPIAEADNNSSNNDNTATLLTCDDFVPFSAGSTNKCGSDGQGGSECKSECCPAQKDYCRGACTLDPNPNGCFMSCLEDRGCDSESTDLTCENFEPFSAGPNNKCGSDGQGGAVCKSECCPAQKDYCRGACKLDPNPNGCLMSCLEDRGCDSESTLSCDDFGTFSAGSNNKCGSDGQGGSKCKAKCCSVQEDYCRGACKLDPNPNGCLMSCLGDRGCDSTSAGLTCDDFEPFSAGPNNKCGSEGQGGAVCKSECCPAQKGYCRGACKLDPNPNGCLMSCLGDRGCDFDSTGLTCDDFGTFSAGPNNKCGSDGQGGSKCKSKCCSVQGSYCERVCVFPSCTNNCLSDRGC